MPLPPIQALGGLRPHERGAMPYQKPDGDYDRYRREGERRVRQHALIEWNGVWLISLERSLQLEHALPQRRHECDKAHMNKREPEPPDRQNPSPLP